MPKICVIGLDGVGADFLQEHLQYLPNLRKIAREGVFGVSRSTLPPMTCPAWNCFMTGHPPNVLGIYDWEDIKLPGRPRLSDWSMRGIPTLWDIVSDAGKGVVAVNVPLTYPPRKVNGAMVSGFPTLLDRHDWTFPPELRSELSGLGIDHVQELNPDTFKLRMGGQNEAEFLENVHRSIQKTLDATRYCMDTYDWDLLVTVFVATDRVQHHFWHHKDASHPRHDPERSAEYSDAILQVYQEIDRAIGELLSVLDDDTHVMVLSDHGFGPQHGNFLINSWLLEQGLLTLKSASASSKARSMIVPDLGSPVVKQLVRLLDKLGLLAFVRRVLPAVLGTKGAVVGLREVFDSIDLTQTKALGLSNGKIYVNSSSAEERDEIASRIRSGLQGLTDPLSGKALASTLLSREEVWADPEAKGPDLYLIVDNYRYGVASKIVRGRLWETPADVAGGHREDGIVLFKGPGVKKGAGLENAYIWDLAPTILHLLDVPVPGQMSARVLDEGFD